MYRGGFLRVPEDFQENPTMSLFASNVKSIKVTPWNGDDWVKDGWDSTKSDTNNRIPQIVKVDVVLWSNDPTDEDASFDENEPTDRYSTIVYLPYALDFGEIKDRLSSFRL